MIVAHPPLRADVDAQAKESLRTFYDALAPRRARSRSRYYNRRLVRYLRFLVPPGKKVLEVGCGDGWLLRQLEPARGLGIDLSPGMIAAAQQTAGTEGVEFAVADVEAVRFDETFDYIVLSDLLGTLRDIQTALTNIRGACDPSTRVVINYHNILWEPLLRAAARMGLKTPQPPQNWLAESDIDNFARLCDFEVVSRSSRLLLPIFVPLLSWLANSWLAALPGLNYLCMSCFLVLRPRQQAVARKASVAVVIPCRNERGNIEAAVRRLPEFGSAQEIIFVDGHSSDGTVEEIQRVMTQFPQRTIHLLHQEGQGKGDAVRMAFARARHEVLMILDADLTVPPEDLPKFYDAIAAGRGEFINGSRLVYPLEKDAMRTLNILGNKFFSVALSRLLRQRIKDTLCGTKVLWRSDYEQIAAGRAFLGELDPFGDFDLLLGAARLNLKIVEVPVRYLPRTYGSTNILRFRHGWMLLGMTCRAFWRFNR